MTALAKWAAPLIVFVALFSVSLLSGTYFNVTWELDAKVRANQALRIAQRGVWLYFFPGPGGNAYVWLPLWQLLLAGIYLLTGINPTQGGILVSALSSGLTGLLVFSILKRIDSVGSPFLGVAFLLTSGYFVAYSSQGMTDIFSVMLFLGSVYFFFAFLALHTTKYLAIASVLTLLNVMTRYEAWLFLSLSVCYAFFLYLRRRMNLKALIQIFAYAFPSVLFILVWLYYNFLVSGNYLGFAAWIAHNELTNPPYFYYSIPLTLFNLVYVLLLSNGLLWLSLVDPRKRTNVIFFEGFAATAFAVYALYFLYATYIGFNAGWVRHFLYFLPFSAVTYTSITHKKRNFYFVVGIQVILGVVGFAQNAVFHQIAGG